MPTQTYCTEQSIQEGQVVISYFIWRNGRKIPLFDALLPSDPDLTPELTLHVPFSQLRVSLDLENGTKLDPS